MNGCVCYFGRTVCRPSPAFASCAEEGVSLGGKVAVRAWPSSRRVSSLAARVHCDSIFGVVTLPPSERLCRARHCPPACRSKGIHGVLWSLVPAPVLFWSVRVRVNGMLFQLSFGQLIHRACAGTGRMPSDRHIPGNASYLSGELLLVEVPKMNYDPGLRFVRRRVETA
ncbi:hypothetical protein TcCL_Unassigned01892 [Trypanosoma cruzi]|nr:hypothetical protein TcCL_Unassigned01892 [Trypanosoma cruzi]